MNVPCILVMGVAGSGKSTLAAQIARELGIDLIEGDDHHSTANQDKMRRGIALEDADRMPWLDALGALLASRDGGAVLTCSALKRSYRDRLRQAVHDLSIVFLDIAQDAAHARVAERSAHVFPPSLVRSQFEALEPPLGEQGVLRVDANRSGREQLCTVLTWLGRASANTSCTTKLGLRLRGP
jgi:gluconokinase